MCIRDSYAGLRVVIRVPYGGWTQTHLAQVGGLYAEHAQRHRQREECHAKRHGEARLPDRFPEGLHRTECPRLRAFPQSKLWLRRRQVRPQASVSYTHLDVYKRQELESFFGKFVARSRVREAVNALLAARELSFVHVNGRSMLQITPEKEAAVTAGRPHRVTK